MCRRNLEKRSRSVGIRILIIDIATRDGTITVMDETQELDEKCPKCQSPLVMATTRSGKKLKRCSTNVWNAETRSSTGCDYVEWQKGATEQTDEDCPKCGSKLVIYTSAAGKKMKKCSTSSWNRETRSAEGCDYIQWL